MKSAFDMMNEAGESWVRAVHAGDVSRKDAGGRAEDLGFPKTAGQFANRFICGHDDVEFIVAAYLKGQGYKDEVGAEIVFDDRNEASAVLHYPQRPPSGERGRALR